MKPHDILIMYGLIALSALSSFLFISYGMNIILSDTALHQVMVFAYVATAYGLANIAILSIAWSSCEAWSCTANKFIGFCFISVFVMDAVNAGIKSALQVVTILVLALVLSANWLAVKKVVSRGR